MLSKPPPRRRRFEAGAAKFAMTPSKGEILLHIATCGMLTTRQVVRITGKGKSGVYKHLRDLKDHKMIQPFAAPYCDFAPPDKPNPAVSWAPGEDILTATRAGIKWLVDAGYINTETDVAIPSVPTRGLFLANEVLIRDVRVWLELCVRENGGSLAYWVDGEAAHFSMVRPDAWFLYKLPGGKTLVGMVEADRKTERGDRWSVKAASYAKLLGSAELAEATGGRTSARIIVVTLDENRRQRIINDVADTAVAPGVFCATLPDIAEGGLSRPVWQTPGRSDLVPLVPESVLSPG